MVKKKTTKVKKKPVKKITKKVSKDTKQDKALKELKKELKKLAKQVLDNAKKKLPVDKFRKLRSSIMDKIPLANTRSKIDKLGNNLLKTPYQNIPSQLARDAKASLETAKQEVKKSIKDELDMEFKEPIKAYNKMKKDLNEVIEKYNNGELSIVEVAVAYKSAKKFANIVGEYLPSISELNTTYRSVKNKLNYLRSWVGSRLRSGDTITEIQNLPPPPPSPSPDPPPAPSPDPPPAPPTEPEPEPEPEPQQSTMSSMYDTARQTMENLNPYVNRAGMAVVGLGMLEGATRFVNSVNRGGRNRDIVRDRMEDAGATMGGRLAQQASQAVIDEIGRQQNQNVEVIRNIRERMNRDSLERLSNRQALRQRDREIRDRQQMGNNLRDMRMSKMSGRTAPATEMKFPQQEPISPESLERIKSDIEGDEMDMRMDSLTGATGEEASFEFGPELPAEEEEIMRVASGLPAEDIEGMPLPAEMIPRE